MAEEAAEESRAEQIAPDPGTAESDADWEGSAWFHAWLDLHWKDHEAN